MLQCGLLRSNFALAIVCPSLSAPASARNRRLVTAENRAVQAASSGPSCAATRRRCDLERRPTTNHRETPMTPPASCRDQDPPRRRRPRRCRTTSRRRSACHQPRLAKMSDAFKREIDKGTVPGVTMLVARRGEIGCFEALGRQGPAADAPMTHGQHLPHLLDDQADRLDRHHATGRGRPLAARRSACRNSSRNSPTTASRW